jgi:hypothetical protein
MLVKSGKNFEYFFSPQNSLTDIFTFYEHRENDLRLEISFMTFDRERDACRNNHDKLCVLFDRQ